MEKAKISETDVTVGQLPVKLTMFDQSLNKLFEVLECIFTIKAGSTGRGHESPAFTDFINFQKYHKLYGDKDIKPLFAKLLKDHQDDILADNFGFLNESVVLNLKVIVLDKKTKTEKNKNYALRLGKFYDICLGFWESG